MTSDAALEFELIRASALLEQDPAQAAKAAAEILKRDPSHETAQMLMLAAQRRLGKGGEAITIAESLAAATPESPVALLELARTYAAAGRHPEARASLERAVQSDPRLAEGWRELAFEHLHAGDDAAADRAYRRYLDLSPAPPQLVDANVALGSRRFESAESFISAYLQASPKDVQALHLAGSIANLRGDDMQAEARWLRCLALAPAHIDAREDLARLLLGQERTAEAMPHIDRLLIADPHNQRYVMLKGHALRLSGQSEKGVELVREFLEAHPDPEAWVMFGTLNRDLGNQAAAVEAFRRALAVHPGYGEAYWALANLKTFRFEDSDLKEMQRHLEEPSQHAVALEFSIGKALEDRRQFGEAFEHYERGNARHRSTIEYDDGAIAGFVRQLKTASTVEFFAQRQGWGSQNVDPIFIVGMPRSGSTLLEQILSSHSQVEGTRELPYIPNIARRLAARANEPGQPDYPDCLKTLTQAEAESLAALYLEQTRQHRTKSAARFVDKMLGNFNHIALLQLLFPGAVIIDARRHPMATCFSCYKQRFIRGMNFSFNLTELGRYYSKYAEIMAHMNAVLPGRIYRLQYEQLIANPEQEVRALLTHCGLAFEPGCMRFYENTRVVHTISSEQVRRPLYSESVDQWRNFEPFLGPLQREVEGL